MRIQSKWIILQLTSLLCYITIFPAIFAAVPLALFRIEAPRKYYLSFILGTNVLLISYFGFIKTEGIAFALGYTLISFLGTLLAELLLKFYPVPTIEIIGQEQIQGSKPFWKYYLAIAAIPLLIILVWTLAVLKTGFNPELIYEKAKNYSIIILNEPSTLEVLTELKKSTSPDAEQIVRLLENPDLFASQMMFVIPSYFLMGYIILAFFSVFFMVRLGQFSIKTLNPIWIKNVVYEYRNHDISIIVAIAVLGWSLFHQQLPLSTFWQQHGAILGSSLINVVGVFFFFQGLMVCLHLLDRWGIKGFFGAIILFIILLTVIKAVAILGLVDVWLDFRKRSLGFGNKKLEK